MIVREPESAAEAEYDVVIVGGGIHGACALLDASQRGLRALLVERDDFGGATSWNSLRILHGGLRYLQHLDLRRFRESVSERRWFCQNFADLLRPLPCLMPLYGIGFKRRSVFRAALTINDWLARRRNVGVNEELRLPSSQLLSREETAKRFPLVDRHELQGGALWYDVAMLSPQRILIEILHWACSLGAVALNYVEAVQLLTSGKSVAGLVARDRVNRRLIEYKTSALINCSGPWCGQVAQTMDKEAPALFRPSLAFNVLLDREPLSQTALAIQPRSPGAPMYFTHPIKERAFVGTYHAPMNSDSAMPGRKLVDESLLNDFLQRLNLAVPGWCVRRSDVIRVFAGLLPATGSGSADLARREVVLDHAQRDGPNGLVSLCGVKFTTARRAAERALDALNGRRSAAACRDGASPRQLRAVRPRMADRIDLLDETPLLSKDDSLIGRRVQNIVNEEAVVELDDLIYRRTDWGIDPRNVPQLCNQLKCLLADQACGTASKPARADAEYGVEA